MQVLLSNKSTSASHLSRIVVLVFDCIWLLVCRCPCTWRQRWHLSEDLPSSCHQQTLMLVLPYSRLAMNQDVHPTGRIPFYGVCFPCCRRLLSTNGAWASALASAKGDSSRMPKRKNNSVLCKNLDDISLQNMFYASVICLLYLMFPSSQITFDGFTCS